MFSVKLPETLVFVEHCGRIVEKVVVERISFNLGNDNLGPQATITLRSQNVWVRGEELDVWVCTSWEEAEELSKEIQAQIAWDTEHQDD